MFVAKRREESYEARLTAELRELIEQTRHLREQLRPGLLLLRTGRQQ